MSEISRSQEALALMRDPARNAEIFRGKFRNFVEPIMEAMGKLKKNPDIRKLLREAQLDREHQQQLERELLQRMDDVTQVLKAKVAQIDQQFKDNSFRHQDLELFNIPLDEYLQQGWELYVSEIPPAQIEAALENVTSRVGVQVEDNEGQVRNAVVNFFEPGDVQEQLEQFSAREQVFGLDYFPDHQKGTARVNFFSPDTGSIIDNGFVLNQSTTVNLDLASNFSADKLELKLDAGSKFHRKDSLASALPTVLIRKQENGSFEPQYLNIKPTAEMKIASLNQALLKLKWMAYAIENVGKEYFARANLVTHLPAAESSSRTQTAGSVFIDADSTTLERRNQILNPPEMPRKDDEPGFFF